MRICYYIFIGVFVVSYAIIFLLAHKCNIDIPEIYDVKLRPYLFTGFLSIGGFLLTLKVFIVISLKEKLYEQEFYKKIYKERRDMDDKISLYGSLINLGSLLIFCVGLAISTSILQISLGLVKNIYCTGLCIAMAHATLTMVIFAWWQIKKSLDIWFDHLRSQNLD